MTFSGIDVEAPSLIRNCLLLLVREALELLSVKMSLLPPLIPLSRTEPGVACLSTPLA
jgi:hypothetical protein